jgi:hypothetical protein
MIPATNSKLLVAEDWTKIYQSFQNSDFTSYDFETIRRTMINYLNQKYPEDFNDYVDSSEYVALIELIAFIAQNLSFRIDLNARENFLETAQRKDSVIQLAQLINYSATRNSPASGLIKITAIKTTDNVIDASGINLANQPVGWNDPTNSNWYQQFISILNSAMPGNFTFGTPYARSTISNVPSEQYKINSANIDVPVYSFSRPIDGTTIAFEIVPSTFSGQTYIYENTPQPGSNFSYIYQNDGKGAGSNNTGFFVLLKQGDLRVTSFSISNPVTNEIVGVDAPDINDSDVWLWQMDSNNNYANLWTKVDSVTGNNVIYNSISNSNRNIYAVTSRTNDQIDLNFADGAFGNLPVGNFNLFYRQSNGLTYSITPDQMRGIQVQIPYYNKSGQSQTLSLTLSLQYTITNSTASESVDNIKKKAPQIYYTQNRMITGEDYNIAPLNAGTDILKVKSVNRTSSGISKFFDLSDVSGKYSSTNIFATDGALYKEYSQSNFEFSFTSNTDIYSVVTNQLADIVNSNSVKAFYYDNWPRPDVSDPGAVWIKVTSGTNQSTGYLADKTSYLGQPSKTVPVQVGYFSSNTLQYAYTGALVKILPPAGNYFLPNGNLTTTQDDTTVSYRWIQITNVVGDGANGGKGALTNGSGPIIVTGNVPTGCYFTEIIPEFGSILIPSIQTSIVNLCLANRNFGLSFSSTTRSWYIITDTNLDLVSPFSLLFQEDTTNSNLDASWVISFQWTGINYKVYYRSTQYIFESKQETAFFFDPTNVNYDFVTNTVIKDNISVLGINNAPNSTASLGEDYNWQIDSSVVEADGYIEPKKVKVSFYSNLVTGQIQDPDAFTIITNPTHVSAQTGYLDNFVYFQINSDGSTYLIVDTSITPIEAYPNETYIASPNTSTLYYLYDTDADVVTQYDPITYTYNIMPLYYARPGRTGLKFHYQHNSGDDRRLDPGKTNIMDVYILNASYDTAYRAWLAGGSGAEPMTPTSSSLEENYASVLEPIKAISDEIVYQPVTYKPLFGSAAESNLQATFKAVKNSAVTISDNEIKNSIITAINTFFSLDNWDFGQSFYFSELSTYVMNLLTPNITNFVIVPTADVAFGSLYEIACQSNEIFINAATVDNIQIISAITSTELKTTSTVITSV